MFHFIEEWWGPSKKTQIRLLNEELVNVKTANKNLNRDITDVKNDFRAVAIRISNLTLSSIDRSVTVGNKLNKTIIAVARLRIDMVLELGSTREKREILFASSLKALADELDINVLTLKNAVMGITYKDCYNGWKIK